MCIYNVWYVQTLVQNVLKTRAQSVDLNKHKSHIGEEDRQERAVESAPRGGEQDTLEARVKLGGTRVHF